MEEVQMNAVSNESVGLEVEAEVTSEMDAGLVEVGAVSETKGGFLGTTTDNGAGYMRF
jgi:hypothetical protein